jgi:hypothetical protein
LEPKCKIYEANKKTENKWKKKNEKELRKEKEAAGD